MAYEHPDRPTSRPDSVIEDGHKAPDQRKVGRSYLPIALAVAAILTLAAVAAVATHESEEQVERSTAPQSR